MNNRTTPLRHILEIPTWFSFFKLICLIQLSSACVERVNGVFTRVVGPQQQSSLEETIEARVLLASNHFEK